MDIISSFGIGTDYRGSSETGCIQNAAGQPTSQGLQITSVQIRPCPLSRRKPATRKGLFVISVSAGCSVTVKAPAIAKRLFAPESSKKDRKLGVGSLRCSTHKALFVLHLSLAVEGQRASTYSKIRQKFKSVATLLLPQISNPHEKYLISRVFRDRLVFSSTTEDRTGVSQAFPNSDPLVQFSSC
jgi:hypothetical protein